MPPDELERRRGGLVNGCRRLLHALEGELHPERNRYRDVLIVVGLGFFLWGALIATGANHTAARATRNSSRANQISEQATQVAEQALRKVQQGRSTSIGVICAVESAIGEAGKETITGGGVLPPALDMFLQRHGYPPPEVRERAARQQAKKYIDSISGHIAKELRQRGKSASLVSRLLRPDGTINCRELSRIANVHVQ